jgi:hypothetical protein
MANKYSLSRTVQDREDLRKVVNSQFTTFTQPTVDENNDTVEELFRLYESLYLDIPLQGTQSHTFLIEESSKLVDIVQNNLDIEPLLDEISDLRQRLLDSQETILDLERQLANGTV